MFVSILSGMNCYLLAFLIPSDDYLRVSYSWSFCNQAITPVVCSHFMLKFCTSFPPSAEKKAWWFFFFFFTLWQSEGREGHTSKDLSQHDENEMAVVKALRPK